jgi:hypothetical protein
MLGGTLWRVGAGNAAVAFPLSARPRFPCFTFPSLFLAGLHGNLRRIYMESYLNPLTRTRPFYRTIAIGYIKDFRNGRSPDNELASGALTRTTISSMISSIIGFSQISQAISSLELITAAPSNAFLCLRFIYLEKMLAQRIPLYEIRRCHPSSARRAINISSSLSTFIPGYDGIALFLTRLWGTTSTLIIVPRRTRREQGGSEASAGRTRRRRRTRPRVSRSTGVAKEAETGLSRQRKVSEKAELRAARKAGRSGIWIIKGDTPW